MRNLWKREEIILALDVYFDSLDDEHRTGVKSSPPDARGKHTAAVNELADILNQSGYTRSETAIRLKIREFIMTDPDNPDSDGIADTKLDRKIWLEYSDSREKLKSDALKIRKKWQESK